MTTAAKRNRVLANLVFVNNEIARYDKTGNQINMRDFANSTRKKPKPIRKAVKTDFTTRRKRKPERE